jgi:hypothetical protein
MVISPLKKGGRCPMPRDPATTERLRNLITKIEWLTENGDLHWERQLGSAHRYARWNNNLLILGPAAPLTDTQVARYLFVTPFDSPSCIEINSDDQELGALVKRLVQEVETISRSTPERDPFSINEEVLERLESL